MYVYTNLLNNLPSPGHMTYMEKNNKTLVRSLQLNQYLGHYKYGNISIYLWSLDMKMGIIFVLAHDKINLSPADKKYNTGKYTHRIYMYITYHPQIHVVNIISLKWTFY